jgi:hypothetical protein
MRPLGNHPSIACDHTRTRPRCCCVCAQLTCLCRWCCHSAGTFSGEGRCTSVPQLPEGQSLSRTRSCVSSYPTRSAEGLLWVWPDASPTAPIESADENAWPGLAPELDEYGDRAFSKRFGNHKWYARWVAVCAREGQSACAYLID